MSKNWLEEVLVKAAKYLSGLYSTALGCLHCSVNILQMHYQKAWERNGRGRLDTSIYTCKTVFKIVFFTFLNMQDTAAITLEKSSNPVGYISKVKLSICGMQHTVIETNLTAVFFTDPITVPETLHSISLKHGWEWNNYLCFWDFTNKISSSWTNSKQ